MKRKMKSFVAAFAATTILLGAMPSVTWADDAYTGVSGDTGAKQREVGYDGGDFLLTKSLVIENDANIPESSFKFTITPTTTKLESDDRYVIKETTNPSDKLSVFVGVNPGAIAVRAWDVGDAAEGTLKSANVTGTTGDNSKTITIEYAEQKVTNNSGTVSITKGTSDDDVTIVSPSPNVTDETSYLANKSVLLDFTACGFSEPGVYRYLISESDVKGAGIQTDSTPRTLDVYVINDDSNAGKLKVQGYVLYKTDITNAEPKANYTVTEKAGESTNPKNYYEDGTEIKPNQEEAGTTKSSGFENTYVTSNLTVGKRVEGNQGSKDKFFKFTVKIAGASTTDKFTVKVSTTDSSKTVIDTEDQDYNANGYQNAATAYKNSVIASANAVTEIPVVGTTESEYTVYLKSGQYVTLTGLPEDAKYKIEEDKEDYVQTFYGDISDTVVEDEITATGLDNLKTKLGDGSFTSTEAGTATGISDGTVDAIDKEYAFVNKKAGVIPTGIIMSVAPAIGLVFAGLAAAFAVVLGGKRRKEELEEE